MADNTTPFDTYELVEGLYWVGLYDLGEDAIRNDYSGRGMYGDRCFGITHDGTKDALLGLAFLKAIMEHEPSVDMDDALETAASIAKAMRSDSMGRDVISYFPGWLLPDDGENDEDEIDDVQTLVCPEHGLQLVIGTGTFGPRHDSYGASKLMCGHFVGSMGPGDPLIIVAARDDALEQYR